MSPKDATSQCWTQVQNYATCNPGNPYIREEAFPEEIKSLRLWMQNLSFWISQRLGILVVAWSVGAMVSARRKVPVAADRASNGKTRELGLSCSLDPSNVTHRARGEGHLTWAYQF
jgi:hypothetical protein